MRNVYPQKEVSVFKEKASPCRMNKQYHKYFFICVDKDTKGGDSLEYEGIEMGKSEMTLLSNVLCINVSYCTFINFIVLVCMKTNKCS